MKVLKVYCNNNLHDLQSDSAANCDKWTYTIAALNNTILEKKGKEIIGDSTEVALYNFALQNNYAKHNLLQHFPLLHVLPFDAQRKCMTTIHSFNDSFISFTKGAPDVILANTNFGTDAEKTNIEKAIDNMASEGLRIIAFSYRIWKDLPSEFSSNVVESGMTFVALTGIADPLRAESRSSVELCKTAGIKPIMITGDYATTAKIIAKQTGIIETDKDILLTSSELNEMSDEILSNKIEYIKVLARATPEQKLRIVKILQQKGEFVGMTGDGVNDAPALQLANIGIAMGITGTDVSKESADIVLLDDNFSTIVKAIKEGRRIYDNIRKFIRYVLTGNTAEVFTIFLAPFFGLPVPLLPIHILWINLMTDGLPGLALASEKSERLIMERPPRPSDENIFSNGMGWQIVWAGFLMSIICIVTQAIGINNGAHWQTMVFTVLCFSQLGNAMAVRSETASTFTLGAMSNKFMFYAITSTVAFQVAIIYIPLLNRVFKTQPLTTNELMLAFLLSAINFSAIEIEKFIRRMRT
jgi:Ca2+-transporting ATPase